MNNLYGWAMSQPMPSGGFRFVPRNEYEQINWLTQEEDQDIGYIVTCDVTYPPELHELHNEYPMMPEPRRIVLDMLSEKQLQLFREYNVPRSSMTYKLLPTFLPRYHYTMHFAMLRFVLEHGALLITIHSVIEFRQSRWLAPYITLNTRLRSVPNNSDFEKDFFKLMNNSVYGKTCENQKKRTDIKLSTKEKELQKWIAKPHCKRFKIFDVNLAAIELRKLHPILDKPCYVGFSVLEYSKLIMYRFHYDYFLAKYGAQRAHLCFTDTDSLLYHVETDNIYADMYTDRVRFDFSDYARTSPYFEESNRKVIGKMKDEMNGKPIIEFVGLRAKMYSLLVLEPVSQTVIEKHRAKGIQRAASAELRHAQYLAQLNIPSTHITTNRRIGAEAHQLYTLEMRKRGLCSFDDKRFLLADGIHSLSYGHHDIPAREAQRPALAAEQRGELVLDAGMYIRRYRPRWLGRRKTEPPRGADPRQAVIDACNVAESAAAAAHVGAEPRARGSAPATAAAPDAWG